MSHEWCCMGGLERGSPALQRCPGRPLRPDAARAARLYCSGPPGSPGLRCPAVSSPFKGAEHSTYIALSGRGPCRDTVEQWHAVLPADTGNKPGCLRLWLRTLMPSQAAAPGCAVSGLHVTASCITCLLIIVPLRRPRGAVLSGNHIRAGCAQDRHLMSPYACLPPDNRH